MDIWNEQFGEDRRLKHRFALQRELRYKVLQNDRITATGTGQTVDLSSRGVGFEAAGLKEGMLVELSISWPVLLDENCPMRLIIFGRVVRASKRDAACTIDRYEFSTQARVSQLSPSVRIDGTLRRWADAAFRDPKPVLGRA